MTHKFLSIDPSLRCSGIVQWQDGKPVEARCVRTQREAKARRIYAGDDDCRRLAHLENTLRALQLNGYEEAVAEQPAGSQSNRGAESNGMMKGVLVGVFGTAVRWVQARDVKYAATNSYNAAKRQMVAWAKRQFPAMFERERAKPEEEAIADALAVMVAYGGK